MLPALLVLAYLQADPNAVAPELPAFPAKWKGLITLAEKHEGKPVSRITGMNQADVVLKGDLPIERELRLAAWLRPAGAPSYLELKAYASDAHDHLIKAFSHRFLVKQGKWSHPAISFYAPPQTASVQVSIINSDDKPLDVSSPQLTLGGPMVDEIKESGVMRASSGTVVEGDSGKVQFPIPAPNAEQVPISFHLTAEPAGALKGYEIKNRTGNDWICEADVAPPKNKLVTLRWESVILVKNHPLPELVRVGFGTNPEFAKPWLAPSPVVESTDPDIIAKAKELKKDASDVETYVRRVIEFTSTNQGTGKPFVALDASTALGCGGSCTSRANLAAALLRAGGVPARTVSHLPTWAYGDLLYEHWLTEYWHPGTGWVRVEPTLGKFAPPASSFAALSTATVDDEKLTGKPGQFHWIMPGAAWMSGIQGDPGLLPAGEEEDGNSNWCRAERNVPLGESIFIAAKKAWPAIMRPGTGDAAEHAAEYGKPEALLDALKKLTN